MMKVKSDQICQILETLNLVTANDEGFGLPGGFRGERGHRDGVQNSEGTFVNHPPNQPNFQIRFYHCTLVTLRILPSSVAIQEP